MMSRYVIILAAVLLLVAGCSLPQRRAAERYGKTFYLDGAGNLGFGQTSIAEGLRAAGASLEHKRKQHLAGGDLSAGKKIHRPFSDARRAEVRRIIDALDSQGRWVENDKTISKCWHNILSIKQRRIGR